MLQSSCTLGLRAASAWPPRQKTWPPWPLPPDTRVALLTKFVKVARCLAKLHNYNSLMSILSGLNCAAAHRLAKTRARLDKKTAQQLERLQTLVETTQSYKNYR